MDEITARVEDVEEQLLGLSESLTRSFSQLKDAILAQGTSTARGSLSSLAGHVPELISSSKTSNPLSLSLSATTSRQATSSAE